MKTPIDVFRLPKDGNAPEENEDANWPLRASTTVADAVRIAIADGATDSARSRIWSQLLVRDFGKRRMDQSNLEERLPRLAKIWKRAVYRPDLPWYAKAKMRLGSFAAFVGLELTEADSVGHWSAVACGDSVMFHVRSDELLQVFPPLRSEDFSNSPRLLGTPGEGLDRDAVMTADGEWHDGDCFYLMTDALACWYLTCYESKRDPWQGLLNLAFAHDPTFDEWIAGLRERGEIRNDDCTLIIAMPELS